MKQGRKLDVGWKMLKIYLARNRIRGGGGAVDRTHLDLDRDQ
jgi:hypothetical protein